MHLNGCEGAYSSSIRCPTSKDVDRTVRMGIREGHHEVRISHQVGFMTLVRDEMDSRKVAFMFHWYMVSMP
ncbi:hypothetical protein K445DRAFT_315954 [Daldinia sp. EC12]|nr:hypothetical protein K445DRAFT_315954 [Daldinia sp. EC12]